MEYYDHPSYGEENHDDKFIIVTVDKTPSLNEYHDVKNDIQALFNTEFSNLGYCDGDSLTPGFEHDWEKTDTCPRGLLGCVFNGNAIKLWASEGTTADYFLTVTKAVLTKASLTQAFAGAAILDVETNGVSIPSTGAKTLAGLAQKL